MMAGPCYRILKAYAMIQRLPKAAKGSKEHHYLPLKPQAPLDLMDHMAQLAK